MFNVYPSHDNCPVHMVCDILLLCLLPQYAQQDAAADLDLDNDDNNNNDNNELQILKLV